MTFLNKYGTILIIILLLLMNMNMCGTATNSVLKKKTISLEKKVDSLNLVIQKNIKIEGLKTSKRMLYDNNSIIRTVERPDDRMNEYDKEIKILESSK